MRVQGQVEKLDAGRRPHQTWREERFLIATIFTVALLLRLALLFQIRNSVLARVPILDAAYYYAWAQRIALGDWRGGPGVYTMSPGYSYLLAVIFKILGRSPSAIALVQSVIGAASCVLTYQIARKFFPSTISAIAGLLLACCGAPVFYSTIVSKVSWIEFFNATCLLAFLSAIDNPTRRGYFLVSGIFLGISAQFRPNVLLFLPLATLCLWTKIKEAQRTRWTAAGSLLLGTVLILLPVALRNRVVGGEWVLTTAHGGMNFYTGNNPQSAAPYRPLPFARSDPQYEQDDFYAEAIRRTGKALTRKEASQFWYSETIRLVRQDARRWLIVLIKKFWLLWSNYEQPINQNFYLYRENFSLLWPLSMVGYSLIAPLGIFGLLLSLKKNEFLPLHFYLLAQTASLMAFFVVSEYREPITIALVVYSAGTLEWFRANWRARSFGRVAGVVVILIIGGNVVRGPSAQELSYRQDLAVAYNDLGGAYMTQNLWAEASEAIERAASILPSFGGAHYNLSECYLRQNRPYEAKAQLLEARRLQPGFLPKHFDPLLAQIYAEMGEWGQAESQMKKSVDSDPDNVDDMFNLALIYQHENRQDKALEVLDKLLSVQPDNEQALLFSAELSLSKNEKEKAFKTLSRLVVLSPNDPVVHNMLGDVFARLGDYKKAKAEFERSLILAPEFSPAKLNIERLNRILTPK